MMDEEYLEVHRDISFRGRKNQGYAHWSKGGRKDVITLYLNIIYRDAKAMWGDDEHMLINIFFAIDFHEWLHLYIRRRSGLKGTYIVTEEVHEMMNCLDEWHIGIWIGELLYYRNQTDPDSIARFFERGYEYERQNNHSDVCADSGTGGNCPNSG